MARCPLTYEKAVAMLPEGDSIHAFRNSPGVLIGADWERADILEVIKKHGAELAGPTATGMGHGLYVNDGIGLWIETVSCIGG